MDRECLYPGHPDTCTPWHYLERDGGRRMVTRVLVKVWTHRHPGTTGADLAVLLTLAAHAGPDTTVGLDYEALAAKTGMSFQEATAAVDRLLQRGDLQPASEGWVAVSLNGAAR
jgi:3'-phosphoadenosine 5'-phosphosulfate sulfotransferase (PAPS reductase)/FAD synthetase